MLLQQHRVCCYCREIKENLPKIAVNFGIVTIQNRKNRFISAGLSLSSASQMSDIATNKKARRDYLISDTYECGIVLRGTEVKSIRAGRVNMSESYARIDKGELWLLNCDIRPYDHTAGFFQHETTAARKLLMHRREIDRLFGQVEQKGVTLVPLRLYWKDGRVKAEIGIGKGKTHRDQRDDLKKRDQDREIAREMARFNK